MQGIIYSAFLDDKLVVVTPSQGKTFPPCFPPKLGSQKWSFIYWHYALFPKRRRIFVSLCFPKCGKRQKIFQDFKKIPFFFFLEQNRMKEEEEERLFPCPERFAPLSTIAVNDANFFAL